MRDVVILFVHLIVTVARVARGPGGLRSVVAESVLVKHQLRILSGGRKRAPNLRASDRIIAGFCIEALRPVATPQLDFTTNSFSDGYVYQCIATTTLIAKLL